MKKRLTEANVFQNFIEKLAITLLKGRFYKIANELKKDPELFAATEKFNKAVETFKKDMDEFKEKRGFDLRDIE